MYLNIYAINRKYIVTFKQKFESVILSHYSIETIRSRISLLLVSKDETKIVEKKDNDDGIQRMSIFYEGNEFKIYKSFQTLIIVENELKYFLFCFKRCTI